MAGKSDYLENAILKLLFNATSDSLFASATGSMSNLYCALHTGDPLDSGTQTSNEVQTAAYATYTRVAVARTSGGFTVTGSSVSPVAAITFPTTSAVGTGCTATHFSIGELLTGAGKIFYAGPITPNIVIPATTAGVIPQLTTATTVTED